MLKGRFLEYFEKRKEISICPLSYNQGNEKAVQTRQHRGSKQLCNSVKQQYKESNLWLLKEVLQEAYHTCSNWIQLLQLSQATATATPFPEIQGLFGILLPTLLPPSAIPSRQLLQNRLNSVTLSASSHYLCAVPTNYLLPYCASKKRIEGI